jgi:hypothetical protein
MNERTKQDFRIREGARHPAQYVLAVLVLLPVLAAPMAWGTPAAADDTTTSTEARDDRGAADAPLAAMKPRLVRIADQKMLQVKAMGDPEAIGQEAFSLLFRTYFACPATVKGAGQAAPRARWPQPLNTPRSEWIGLYGLPVPDTLSSLPAVEVRPGLEVSLTVWPYGEMAEILHVGPYNREDPTIARLAAFVSDQGYVIMGPHEEEYLRGPTMFGRGDPEQYQTIIRYRVRRAGEQ